MGSRRAVEGAQDQARVCGRGPGPSKGPQRRGPGHVEGFLKDTRCKGFTQKKEKVELTSYRRQKKHVQSRKAHHDKGPEMPCSRTFGMTWRYKNN